MKKILCAMMIFILIIGVPAFLFFDVPGLIDAEINTWLWGEEFDDPELFTWETIPVKSVDKIKVLEYTSKNAKVYYVLNNYQTAYVNHYKKVDGKWQYGPYSYLLWDSEHLGGNRDSPSAYWWYYRLRNKYQPISEKYKTNTPVDHEDIIRHPEKPLTQE